jgi:signal peptidase II
LKKSVAVWGIIALVLLIDQCLKIWIKTHLEYGDEFNILGFSWARIHFVENNGMAFGINLGGEYGKLALSLFRIIAVGFLVYYLRVLLRSGAAFGLLISFSLILAGAIGNIIDSAFYGMIFSESPYHGGLAQLFPEGGGYSSFLHGKVVDMLYFPLVEGVYPDWFPLWGGQHYQFFKPVFNIADSSITVGVLYILLFQRSFFKHKHPDEETEAGQAALQPEHTTESLADDTSLEGEAAADEATANDAGKDQA